MKLSYEEKEKAIKEKIEYLESLVISIDADIDAEFKQLEINKKEMQNKVIFKAIRKQMELIENNLSNIEQKNQLKKNHLENIKIYKEALDLI